jgi:hypothetical protein
MSLINRGYGTDAANAFSALGDKLAGILMDLPMMRQKIAEMGFEREMKERELGMRMQQIGLEQSRLEMMGKHYTAQEKIATQAEQRRSQAEQDKKIYYDEKIRLGDRANQIKQEAAAAKGSDNLEPIEQRALGDVFTQIGKEGATPAALGKLYNIAVGIGKTKWVNGISSIARTMIAAQTAQGKLGPQSIEQKRYDREVLNNKVMDAKVAAQAAAAQVSGQPIPKDSEGGMTPLQGEIYSKRYPLILRNTLGIDKDPSPVSRAVTSAAPQQNWEDEDPSGMTDNPDEDMPAPAPALKRYIYTPQGLK